MTHKWPFFLYQLWISFIGITELAEFMWWVGPITIVKCCRHFSCSEADTKSSFQVSYFLYFGWWEKR